MEKIYGMKGNNITLPTSSVLRPARRPKYFRECLCLFIALASIAQIFLALQLLPNNLMIWGHTSHAANATLGFGNIYAVSRRGSPRRQSLLDAAALTNLDMRIPEQPPWSEEDIAAIKAPINSSLNRGSAMAWLGHRNALQEFLKSSEDTALIVEDDVDWDTRLRTQQIPQTAYAIKELLGSHDGSYYGSTDSWDIIWLGHCGDYFNATRGSTISNIKAFNDPAMPEFNELHPWTRDFLHGIGAGKNQQRLVHESVRPLCTFAYAITRKAAERVLNELAVKEPVRDLDQPCRAFDVRLLEGCRDEGLRCISVNPELFHHTDLDSEIAQVTGDTIIDDTGSDSHGRVEIPTTNIRCSARSKKWFEIQTSITDPVVDAEIVVRELAELSTSCYIDDF